VVYFTQGIEGLPSQGLFYYLKETLKYPPEKIMYLASITTFAWLVKPVIGYIIDNFLNKRIWIFLSLALDIALVLVLGLLWLPIVALVGLLIFNSTNAAFRDVAVDGIMCVEGKKAGSTGKIQSIQWISISVAGLLTGVGGGYIAEKWGYQAAFLMLIPVYLAVGLVALLYRQQNGEQIESSAHIVSDMRKLFSHKHLIIVGVFIFLYRFSPSIGTPLFFIQRDNFGWSKVWIGWLATISTVFGIAGSLLYYEISKKINIKKWLFCSVFVGAVTTLSYLYYTPVSAVVYDIIYSLMGMFIFLMSMDFMARNSVKGLEATSFALLCSFSNLALVASNLSGAILLPKIGLNWLIVISALTSFLCLPLISKIEDKPLKIPLEAGKGR
jgi:predicted MFS family arabinose efflux permease